jgi:hypothetical protein
MIAATLAGFAVAALMLAAAGALARRHDAARNSRQMDEAVALVSGVIADDRKLAAGVVSHALNEAISAGKHPVSWRVLTHPSGDVIDVICLEDVTENAEQILREGE